MNKRPVILPCETRAREFDAKLLLACHAAESGIPAIVGSKKVIDRIAPSLPRGLYINKSIGPHSTTVLRMLKRIGFTVTAWDEEGLVWASPELYRLTKLDGQALQEPDCIFAWGEANAAAIREHPGFTDRPVHLTGNPRADLLRPELRHIFDKEADALQQRFGKFILVNTNFSLVNHFHTKESRLLHLLEAEKTSETRQDNPKFGLALHKKQIFDHFLHMIPQIASRFPDATLIIRPHPSENHDPWLEAARNHQNVQVIYEGNIIPWLKAATATVHNSCTTAVESFLLDRIALAYCPVKNQAYDHALPNNLSIQSEQLTDLLEQIDQTLAGHTPIDVQRTEALKKLARHHLASYDGPSSCERLTAIIHQLIDRPPTSKPSLLTQAIGLGTAYGRSALKSYLARKPGQRHDKSYLQHMFPLTTQTEVEQQIQHMGSQLGRFQHLQTQELAENVFMIQ